MARTRIDPWQTEEELPWRPLSHPGKIKPGAKPLSKSVPYTFQNDTHKTFRPKQPETILREYARSLPTCTSPPWAYKPKTNSQPLTNIVPNNKSSANDFEAAASRVLAALNMSGEGMRKSPGNSFSVKRKNLELPDDDKRKNMVPKVILRDIGAIISKVCPKLVHSPSKEESLFQNQHDSEAFHQPVWTQELPTHWDSSQEDVPLARRLKPEVPVVPVTPPNHIPCLTIDPPVVTIDPPIFNLDPPVVTIPDTPDIVIPESLVSELPFMSSVSISKSISHTLQPSVISSSKTSPRISEKSSTPVSTKSATYSDPCEFAAMLPLSPSLKKSSTNPVAVASYPKETASSSVNPNQLQNKAVVQSTSASEAESREIRFKSSISSHVAKPNRFIKNGYPGFLEEDPKRLKKTRFHVNTNILASSLDLLDLHKPSGMSSGSPSNCIHCNLTFSSVKHCKYHQSVSSMEISSDPTKQQNLKEDGVWLCPWCPVMCGSMNYLNTHKLECREKGHCNKIQKDSSLRKNASSSSRRKTSFSSSNSLIPTYKFMPGNVITV